MATTQEQAGTRYMHSTNNCVTDHGKTWCQLVKGVSPYARQHSMWEQGPGMVKLSRKRVESALEMEGAEQSVHLQYFYKACIM